MLTTLFYNGGGTAAVPEEVVYVGRDLHLMLAIQQALIDTGEFDVEGVYCFHPDYMPAELGQTQRRIAFVTIDRWREEDPRTGADGPAEWTRTVEFLLAIVTADEDPVRAQREVDRLSQVASNAINGTSIGGLSMPSMTRLREGRYNIRKPPFLGVTLRGIVAYPIFADDDHYTVNDVDYLT